MKTSYALLAAILLIVAAAPTVLAQQKQETANEPEYKMVEFHMALLKRNPNPATNKKNEPKDLHQQHFEYVSSLLNSGKAIIAGPLTDAGDLVGVIVFRAQSAEEAKKWAEAEPTVAAGLYIVEMLPWWSADVFGKPEQPLKMTQTFLVFLKRGEKWTPEKTPATAEIQKGHLANIDKLVQMKKLVAAGPFGGGGNLRGIFVFRVDSLEEAKALTATDPAVQAGRLAVDIYPWTVPEGVLPK